MAKKKWTIAPSAKLDYKWDWKAKTNETGRSDWLASGETISTKTVAADAGITVDSGALADTNTSVVVWVTAPATAGGDYDVSVQITTNTGRKDTRTATFQVRER